MFQNAGNNFDVSGKAIRNYTDKNSNINRKDLNYNTDENPNITTMAVKKLLIQ